MAHHQLSACSVHIELPCTMRAPAAARNAVRNFCSGRIEGQMLTDAELLVSELGTNALRHGDGQITLRGSLDDDHLLIEVIDHGGGFERQPRRRHDQIGGWGLHLVKDIANRWGVHETATHVWFELQRPPPRLGKPVV
jgi:anti-sigma regulatory factor (Ser/Thr protein kinase)